MGNTLNFKDLYTTNVLLGRGGFGEVRRCLRKSDGNFFAVKLIDISG